MEDHKPPFIPRKKEEEGNEFIVETSFKRGEHAEVFLEAVNFDKAELLKDFLRDGRVVNYVLDSMLFIQFKINYSRIVIDSIISSIHDKVEVVRYSSFDYSLSEIGKLIKQKCDTEADRKYVFVVEALKEQDGIKTFINKLSKTNSHRYKIWLCSFVHRTTQILVNHFDIHVLFSASAKDLETILSLYPVDVARCVNSIHEKSTQDSDVVFFFRSGDLIHENLRPNPVPLIFNHLSDNDENKSIHIPTIIR